IKKTVVIPLWYEHDRDCYKGKLVKTHNLLGKMCIAMHGTYLGVTIGPERQLHQWDTALDKFPNRAFSWRTAEQGLHHACPIYNTFVISVLSHIWQITPPPEDCYRLEKWL
ncbi:MAG: hypothetical protein ACKPKO_40295, partial [Candidatus Fonsibacter sp.]